MFMQIIANDYLTFEKLRNVETTLPVKVSKTRPNWWKKLPANAKEVTQGCPIHNEQILEEHNYRTAKLCLGLKGSSSLGYTFPLDKEFCPDLLDDPFKDFYLNVKDESWMDYFPGMKITDLPEEQQKECIEVFGYNDLNDYNDNTHDFHIAKLHSEMIHGSNMHELKDDGYKWNFHLLLYPWHARLPKGWRLLVIENPLLFDDDIKVFTGCVDANYKLGDSIREPHLNTYHDIEPITDIEIDTEKYNYFNIEVVCATRNFAKVEKGQSIFSLIPLYDPDYKAPKYKEHPDFS